MSAKILSQLQPLQKPSNRKMNPTIIAAVQDHSMPRALVETTLGPNGRFIVKPRKGIDSLAMANNRRSMRKVKVFSAGSEHIISKLNKELMGGESYPILTTALGIAAGAISGGAGLLFSLTTTGISLATTTGKVLARPGDEIWHIEEIGKSDNKATYVSAYVIVDPYRKQTPIKGWLIHEDREEISLS